MTIIQIIEVAEKHGWTVSTSTANEGAGDVVYLDFIRSFGPPLGSVTITGSLIKGKANSILFDILDTYAKITPEILISGWLEDNTAPNPDVYRDVYEDACDARTSFWNIIHDLFLKIDEEKE